MSAKWPEPQLHTMETADLWELFNSLPDCLDRFNVLKVLHFRCRPFPSQESMALARRLYRLGRTIGEPIAMGYGLEMMCRVQHGFSNYTAALRFLRCALRMYEEAPEPPSYLSQSLHLLGLVHSELGRYADAMDAYRRSLEAARAVNSTVRAAAALTGIGEVYRMLGDYENALAAALESLPQWEALGDNEGLGVAHNNVGIIYSLLKRHDRAIEEYGASLEHYRAASDEVGAAIASGNIGRAYGELGQYATGYPFLQDSLESHHRTGQRRYEGGTRGLLASAFIQEGRFDEALEQLRAALAIYEEVEFPSGVCEVLADMGDVLNRLGRTDEAVAALERVLALAGEIGYRQQSAKGHRLLAKVYEAKEEQGAALRHYVSYMNVHDELQNEEMKRGIMLMEHRMAVERAERERRILLLEAERLQQEVQLRTQELAAMAMRLAQKNEMLASMKKLVRNHANTARVNDGGLIESLVASIESENNLDAEWNAFERRLQVLHPGFMRMLSQRYPELTPAELKVCALLRANVGSKEIATLLSTTVRTVEKHRQHIRRKVGLKGAENLIVHFASM